MRRAAFSSDEVGLCCGKVPYDGEKRQNGLDWPWLGYSMIGARRMDQLQWSLETLLREDVKGDLLEAGVWRGGAGMLMKAILRARDDNSRTVWLADSFQGLPRPMTEADGPDWSTLDYFAVTADQVRANFDWFGLWDERVRLLPGWFSESLPTAPIEKLALLRLDADLYHSTMDVLTHLYPRVSDRGFVIVDDYGTLPACRRAVEDFLSARGESPQIIDIDGSGVYWRKSGLG